jgi:hypothetical protein
LEDGVEINKILRRKEVKIGESWEFGEMLGEGGKELRVESLYHRLERGLSGIEIQGNI